MPEETTMIALTGGPCGGKTTGLCYLQEKLSDYGFHVLIVPESATLLMNMGITPKGNVFPLEDFQRSVMNIALFLEEDLRNEVNNSNAQKNVILCDRGIMDIKAYCPDHLFERLMEERGLSREEIFGRYKAIFHLKSAALGAEKYYTYENNQHRFETLAEAKLADERTLQTWLGHPKLRIFDNSTGFEGKMKRLLQACCRELSIPAPLEIERKFLVNYVDLKALSVPHQEIDIEQIYLNPQSPDEEVRIRKRGHQGGFTYYHTTKKMVREGVRIEEEYAISKEAYMQSRQHQLPGTVVLKKKRSCFVYQNQYFELDVLQDPHKGLTLLEIELTDERDDVTIPNFISVEKEVTGDKSFSNHSLAHVVV